MPGDAAGLYRQAPIILSSANREVPRRCRAVAGAGRQHRDRALQRRNLDVVAGGGVTEALPRAGAKGTNERHFTVKSDAPCMSARPPVSRNEVHRHAGSRADDFARQGSGTSGPRLAADVLQVEDDYGVTEARAQFAPVPATCRKPPSSRGPCSSAAGFRWCCECAHAQCVGQTVKDLSEDPMPAPK